MKNPISIDLHHASLKPELKGRMTKPDVSLDAPEFVYVSALKTDLKATFARAMEKIGTRKVQRVS